MGVAASPYLFLHIVEDRVHVYTAERKKGKVKLGKEKNAYIERFWRSKSYNRWNANYHLIVATDVS